MVHGFDAIGVEKWSYTDTVNAVTAACCVARVMASGPPIESADRMVYGEAPKGGE